MATVTGTTGNDFIHRAGDGLIVPPNFNEVATVTTADDVIIGGSGDDIVYGDAGDDVAIFNAATDGSDLANLGDGSDRVIVLDRDAQFRLTFTSSEVGNANASDSATMLNQDGGLAVRFQAENGTDGLTGPVSRFDDEGITFVASGVSTFDVRDLVSGAQRGNQFRTVTLGTLANDTFVGTTGADYVNAGQGADTVTGGLGDDFLVGGAGDDALNGGVGDDSFIGGGGNDTITGGADDGADTLIFNVTTDGTDSVDLGDGDDIVTVNAAAATNVRLTFTSAEVGNALTTDSGSLANQDGGLAVRLQAEGTDGVPLAATTRLDDEGVTFVGGAGVTFDVRDLVAGTQRGETFEVVTLGTSEADTLASVQAGRPYYINGGQGNDLITGGLVNDFLVGGAGNDNLSGDAGDDTLLGGAGDDRLTGGAGIDRLEGGAGSDIFLVDNLGDTVVEELGGGTLDWVAVSVSNYRLAAGLEIEKLSTNINGGTAPLTLVGNEFAQAITGNDGANTIAGLGGADTLTGRSGNDSFLFNRALSAENIATITDFTNVIGNDDVVRLENAVFAALGGAGALAAAAFIANTSGLAADASDRIIYETDTGNLYYDSNGSASGGRDQFAKLDPNVGITAADFLVV